MFFGKSKSNDELKLHRYGHLQRLIAACSGLPALKVAVVAPEDHNALAGPVLAARAGLIEPILIGDPVKIREAARKMSADISGFLIVDIASHDEAAAHAVAMVHADAAGAVMKGHIHTNELLRHVVKRDGGLRTQSRISHAIVLDMPGLDRPLIITDPAISIAPKLEEKIDITRNAIGLAQAIGIAQPKVALMSAVETVNDAMLSSVEAGAIAKLAAQGAFPGALVDGPFAMDNAINLDAAQTKGMTSPVAGCADILVVPTIEVGNTLYKALVFLAQAEIGGLVLGAKVPIMLTSRADDDKSRLASCAIAVLQQHWLTTGKSAVA